MIGGVTRRGLPHLPAVPHLNFVSPEKSCPKGEVPLYFFLGVSRDTSGIFGQPEGVRTAYELFSFFTESCGKVLRLSVSKSTWI